MPLRICTPVMTNKPGNNVMVIKSKDHTHWLNLMAPNVSLTTHPTKFTDSMPLSRKSATLTIQSLNTTVHWPVAGTNLLLNRHTTLLIRKECWHYCWQISDDVALVPFVYFKLLPFIFLVYTFVQSDETILSTHEHKTIRINSELWQWTLIAIVTFFNNFHRKSSSVILPITSYLFLLFLFRNFGFYLCWFSLIWIFFLNLSFSHFKKRFFFLYWFSSQFAS